MCFWGWNRKACTCLCGGKHTLIFRRKEASCGAFYRLIERIQNKERDIIRALDNFMLEFLEHVGYTFFYLAIY